MKATIRQAGDMILLYVLTRVRFRYRPTPAGLSQAMGAATRMGAEEITLIGEFKLVPDADKSANDVKVDDLVPLQQELIDMLKAMGPDDIILEDPKPTGNYPVDPPQNCGACEHFYSKKSQCRRYPPRAVDTRRSVFPVVHWDDACGAWEPRS